MAKTAKPKQEEAQEVVLPAPEESTMPVQAVVEPEAVIEEDVEQPEHTVEVTPEPAQTPAIVEAAPEQKEIKDSDEIGFLHTIMDTMESGGWGKALHPMIKSRIEYLKNK